MARKIDPTAPLTPRAPDHGANDLETLHPQRDITIAGRALRVREYGWMEGLQLQRSAGPILDALVAASDQPLTGGFEQIMDVLADHPDELTQLVAQAADVDVAFVRGLTDAEGQALLMTWWLANGGFFVRRVVRRLAVRQAVQAQASAGATSTKPSSNTATASATSAATRDGN